MKYPTIRIKALGDRRFEVLPAKDKGCFDLLRNPCRFLEDFRGCKESSKICLEFPVIFKEIK